VSSQPENGWTNTRLVEACVQGNEQAWHTIVNRYKNLVYSIALSYGASQEDAADIFQSVWLDLFSELPRLREAEALQGWLKSAAIHKAYHWKQRRVSCESDPMENGADVPSASAPAPDILQDLEREQLLRDSIAMLPPRCRDMIEMLFFTQPPLPYPEIAERLGIARGSIGFIRGRCLKRLKTILESKGF
jgi:RNA polymerase sigma factor (sigma-70 family)